MIRVSDSPCAEHPRRYTRISKCKMALVLLALILPCQAALCAQEVSFIRSAPYGYSAGQTLSISVNIRLEALGAFTSLGLEETLPPGWVYLGTVSGDLPAVAPNEPVEFLEFLWDPAPSEVTFTYEVLVPPGESSTKVISGRVLYRLEGISGLQETAVTMTTIESLSDVQAFHSADYDRDLQISLSELLRAIQIYRLLGFHCAESPSSTEDGYIPGIASDYSCILHDSDYEPQDWIISLSELLRLIQFYNANSYSYCPDEASEDSYCPALGT